MKHKTSKLLSILLALVMVAGLLPGQVAYAAEEITELTAIGVVAPVPGENPSVSGVTAPAGAHYTIDQTRVSWRSNTDPTWIGDTTFKEGYVYRIYIAFLPDAGYEISKSATPSLEGVDYWYSSHVATNTVTGAEEWCFYFNALGNAPLSITNDGSLNIPAGSCEQEIIETIDLKPTVTGGKAPYFFSITSGPSWLSLSAYDNIVGTRPNTPQAATTATITVTDSDSPKNTASVTIQVGAVTENSNLIKQLTAIGVTPPAVGEMPTTAGIVAPTSANYTVESASWRRIGDDWLGNTPFEAGYRYQLFLIFAPKAGYEIANSEALSSVTLDGVNGYAWSRNSVNTITGAIGITFSFNTLGVGTTEYNVTVNNDGNGTGFASPTFGSDGTVVTLTATPKLGYKFKEWVREAGKLSGGLDVPNATSATTTFTISGFDVVVKATFELIPTDTYTVTVTNDGNGTGSASPTSGTTGTEVTLTATPTSGYQFKEWQVVSGGVSVTDNKFTIGSENIEIKAIFEEIITGQYRYWFGVYNSRSEHGTVSVNGTDWVSAAGNNELAGYEYTAYAKPDGGYVFKEWQDQGGAVVSTEQTYTFTLEKDMRLYAIFEENTSTVKPTITTSTLPDGKVGTAYEQTLAATGDATITWAVESGNLPDGLTLATDGKISGTPTTAGDYTFTVKATNGAGSDTKSYTVKIAAADATTYTVSFNANSGGGTMADMTVIAGEKLTLPECTFTPPSTDKIFDKWDAGKPGDKVDITADCTITAIWKNKPVTKTLSSIAVTTPPTKTTYTAGQSFNKAGMVVTATYSDTSKADVTGYTVSPSGALKTTDTSVTISYTEGGVTKTATQNITVNSSGGSGGGGGGITTQYTLTYNTNGGSAVTATKHNSGTTVNLTATPTKEGFTFDGWYADAALTSKITSIKMDGNKTVYAGWKENTNPNTGAHDCPSAHLKDVDTNAWYHEGVDYVVVKKLMQGIAADQFAPNATTTRAMIVTILYRLEGEPVVSGKSGFDDVEADTWYTNAVAWAEANDIVNGYNGNQFGPMDPITREQMAAIMFRYSKFKGYDTSKTADLSIFTDNGAVSDWAVPAMKWAVAEELFKGVGDNLISPTTSATRAQVATILMRYIENVK